MIGEAGWRWDAGMRREDDSPNLPGRFAIGSWHHNGQFDRFDGGTQSATGGVFVVFDQLVVRENDDPGDAQGIGIFAQFGFASEQVSVFAQHIGTGFTWTGAIQGRDTDSWGMGFSWAQLSDHPGAGFTADFELATELFYGLRIGRNVTTVFDLQHIASPGGRREVRNALVGTIRLIVTY